MDISNQLSGGFCRVHQRHPNQPKREQLHHRRLTESVPVEKPPNSYPSPPATGLNGRKPLINYGRAQRSDVLASFDSAALAGRVPELIRDGAMPGMYIIDWYCDDCCCEVSVTTPIVLTILRPFLSQLDFNRWGWYDENRALDKAGGFQLPASISTFIEQSDDREVSLSLNPKWDDREDWSPEFESEEEFLERLARTDLVVGDAR